MTQRFYFYFSNKNPAQLCLWDKQIRYKKPQAAKPEVFDFQKPHVPVSNWDSALFSIDVSNAGKKSIFVSVSTVFTVTM